MKKFDKIFIHGFRTTGKTTIAKILAKKLEYKLVDMDSEIVKKEGKSIDELTNSGTSWLRFRKSENNLLKKLLLMKRIVVSTGGGLAVNNIIDKNTGIMFGELNRKLLKSKKDVLSIVLSASERVIKRRLRSQELEKKSTKRPVLSKKQAQLLEMKLKRYTYNPLKQKEIIIDMVVKDSINVFRQRKALYAKISPYIIDTGNLTVKKTVEKIEKIIMSL